MVAILGINIGHTKGDLHRKLFCFQVGLEQVQKEGSC